MSNPPGPNGDSSLPVVFPEELSDRIQTQIDKAEPEHGGGYSDVFVGQLSVPGNKTIKIAFKVLRIVNEPNNVNRIKIQLARETSVWYRLHHENVLKFLGVASRLGRYTCPALVSPYCDNGTVSKYLKTRQADQRTRLAMLIGAARGLRYLHQEGIVHGDFKPGNILVDDEGRALLCDFGRSKILDTRGFTTRPAGVARYQAPEFHNGGQLSREVDVFAFGITGFEIWTGVTPWAGQQDGPVILNMVMRDQRPERLPHIVPDALWNLFQKCWTKEPENRPTMAVVVSTLEAITI